MEYSLGLIKYSPSSYNNHNLIINSSIIYHFYLNITPNTTFSTFDTIPSHGTSNLEGVSTFRYLF